MEGLPLGSFAWQSSAQGKEAHPLPQLGVFRRGSAIFSPLRDTDVPSLTYQSCGWSNKAWGLASELGPWPEILQFSGQRD